MSNNLHPNTFQTPNLYIDRLMPYLSDPELRVLLYMTRRILGFLKRQDRVSLSQMVNGISTKEGTPLDFGAGVSESSARQALKSLCELGILRQTAPFVAEASLPPEWELQWDIDRINWEHLATRRETKKASDRDRLVKWRSHKKDKHTPGIVAQGEGVATDERDAGQYQPGIVAQGGGGIVGQYPQNQVETKKETKGGDHTIQDQRAEPAAQLPPQPAMPNQAQAQSVEPALTSAERTQLQAQSVVPAMASATVQPPSTQAEPKSTMAFQNMPTKTEPKTVAPTGDPCMDAAINKYNGNGYANQGKHQIDGLMKAVTELGVSPLTFREMVDAFLAKYGQSTIANLDTTKGNAVLTRAQETILELCAMGEQFRSVAGLEMVYADWYANDWRGQKGERPLASQLIDHVGAMITRPAPVAPKPATPPAPPVVQPERRVIMPARLCPVTMKFLDPIYADD